MAASVVSPLQNLKKLNLTLPALRAGKGNYVPIRRSGRTVYVCFLCLIISSISSTVIQNLSSRV